MCVSISLIQIPFMSILYFYPEGFLSGRICFCSEYFSIGFSVKSMKGVVYCDFCITLINGIFKTFVSVSGLGLVLQ